MGWILRCDVLGLQPPNMARAYPPAVPAVSIDADALFVPSRHGANDSVTITGIEVDPLSDPELNHGHLRLDLTDHPDALNDLSIEFDELFFSQAVQIDLHDVKSVQGDRFPAFEGQEFIHPSIRPDREILQGILQPLIRVDAIELGSAKQRLDDRRTFTRTLGPCKQPSLFTHCNRANVSFDGVIVCALLRRILSVGETPTRGNSRSTRKHKGRLRRQQMG